MLMRNGKKMNLVILSSGRSILRSGNSISKVAEHRTEAKAGEALRMVKVNTRSKDTREIALRLQEA